MTRLAPVICAISFSICACNPTSDPEFAGNIDLAEAARYFREFDALCQGWTLELNQGWKVAAAERTGDFEVRRV